MNEEMEKIYTLEECVAFKNISRLLMASDIREDVISKLKEKHESNNKDDVFYSFKVWVDGKAKWNYTLGR